MIKIVKIPLIILSEIYNYKEINKIIWQIQNEVRVISNKTIQLCWEYFNFESEYKKEFQKYPKTSDILNYSNIFGYVYDKLKKDYNKSYSNNRGTSLKSVCEKFKSDKLDYIKGEKSIASFKNNLPIDIHNKSIKLIHTDKNEWQVKLSLLSNTYKKELNLKDGALLFKMIVKDKSTKAILERCYDEIYKPSASKLIYDKKKKMWVLNLAYKFEPIKNVELNKDIIMGIDMGVVYPVYASFNGSYDRLSFAGGEIDNFRKQVEARRKSLQKQSRYCGEGRIGHGRKTRMKPVEVTADKIANFRDTVNHKYSKRIIDCALKNHAGVIQMEDLKGISADNTFLKNWSYFDLQQKIENKANAVGIEVIKVNPKYTSQRCSKCGYISKDNRPKQDTFHCLNCGYTTNADYNASQNIATKDIDLIIKNSEIDKCKNVS